MSSSFFTEWIRKDIETRKELLDVAFSGSKTEIDAAIESYRQRLISYRKRTREIWSGLSKRLREQGDP